MFADGFGEMGGTDWEGGDGRRKEGDSSITATCTLSF